MYEWVLALHVIAVITWMAALLYLPRLYVYHCGAEVGSAHSETLKVMERRLLRAIANPSMLVAWGAGLFLLLDGSWLTSGAMWIHIKLTLLILLTIFHMFAARWRRDFAADANRRSHVFYRVANEIPTVLMIFIVILVVVKPF